MSGRAIPKVPALRGKTVVVAVLRGLDPHPAVVRDGGQAPLGRHHDLQRRLVVGQQGRDACATPSRRSRPWASTPSSSGTARPACPWRIAGWIDASVINAGDGWHEHPTQALLDCYTIRAPPGRIVRRACGSPSSATSSTAGWPAPTCRLHRPRRRRQLVAPPTLLPPVLEGWPVDRAPRPRRGARRPRRPLPAAPAARADDRGADPVAARVPRPLRADREPGRRLLEPTPSSCTRGR